MLPVYTIESIATRDDSLIKINVLILTSISATYKIQPGLELGERPQRMNLGKSSHTVRQKNSSCD